MQNNEKAQRAKLFQPFDSLKGFRNILKEQERKKVKPKLLFEEELEKLNIEMEQVKKGDLVRVVYYDHGEYIEMKGKVVKLDKEMQKMIQIVRTKIKFSQIVEIQCLEE